MKVLERCTYVTTHEPYHQHTVCTVSSKSTGKGALLIFRCTILTKELLSFSLMLCIKSKMPPKRKKRGTGFSHAEVITMLDIMEKHLPIGGDEWEAVAREHRETWPDTERCKDGIKRKCQNLYGRKEPTGDPTCPPSVKKAKSIQYEIRLKSDCDIHEDDPVIEENGTTENASTSLFGDFTVEREFVDTNNLSTVTNSTISTPDLSVSPFEGATATCSSSTSSSCAKSPMQVLPFQPSTISSPMKQVSRKTSKIRKSEVVSLQEFMQWSMMQKEMERVERDKERREERVRRDAEERRQNEDNRRFQQMFLLAVTGKCQQTDKDHDDKNDNETDIFRV